MNIVTIKNRQQLPFYRQFKKVFLETLRITTVMNLVPTSSLLLKVKNKIFHPTERELSSLTVTLKNLITTIPLIKKMIA
jgi:hypothetical protein